MSQLDALLEKFIQHKELFKQPWVLSVEHQDVTAKYAIAMVELAKQEKKDVVSSFSKDFLVDSEQFRKILSNKNHWMDYLLYTAFAVHAQKELDVSDEKFNQALADKIFLDYSDGAVSFVSTLFPLSVIIGNMDKQFPNWARVTDVKVHNAKPGSLSFQVTRQTKLDAKKRLEGVVGKDLLPAVLGRDCDYTVASFKTIFQKLYRQPDLQITATESERYGSERSVYEVIPAAPYRTKAGIFLTNISRSLVKYFFPWVEVRTLQARNKTFEDEAFNRQEIIRSMTKNLEDANAQLYKRQETIVDMLTEISRLNASGSRHKIRNRYQVASLNLKNDIVEDVSRELMRAYALVSDASVKENKEVQAAKRYLTELCGTFGIDDNYFSNKERIIDFLQKMNLTENAKSGSDDDIFSAVLDDDTTYFLDAFPKACSLAAKKEKHPLSGFNPFGVFNYWRALSSVVQDVNETLASGDKLSFLDEITFSNALELAVKDAQKDKSKELSMQTKIEYDPLFHTHKDTFVMMIRDIVYNAIDAGASTITVDTKTPLSISVTPDGFEDHPQFGALFDSKAEIVREGVYVLVEDNGKGISETGALRLNAYLKAGSTEEVLSSKGSQGGLGTINLRKLLNLHQGKCVYEPYKTDDSKQGTRIHLYFGTLSI